MSIFASFLVCSDKRSGLAIATLSGDIIISGLGATSDFFLRASAANEHNFSRRLFSFMGAAAAPVLMTSPRAAQAAAAATAGAAGGSDDPVIGLSPLSGEDGDPLALLVAVHKSGTIRVWDTAARQLRAGRTKDKLASSPFFYI